MLITMLKFVVMVVHCNVMTIIDHVVVGTLFTILKQEFVLRYVKCAKSVKSAKTVENSMIFVQINQILGSTNRMTTPASDVLGATLRCHTFI